MSKSIDGTLADAAHERIRKKLDRLVEERTASGNAFDAYIKGTLTSSDCSTLVEVVLRQFEEDGGRDAVLLEVVADAVAQVANRELTR